MSWKGYEMEFTPQEIDEYRHQQRVKELLRRQKGYEIECHETNSRIRRVYHRRKRQGLANPAQKG